MNLNELPGALVAGSTASLSSTTWGTLPNLTNIVPGSLATSVQAGSYGDVPTATITTGSGTLVTGQPVAAGTVGNYWEAGAGGGYDTDAGTVVSNITSTSLGITEAPAKVSSVAMVGVVFQPLGAGGNGVNILPVTTALTVAPGATFDLGGGTQTVASLSDYALGSSGTIQNSGAVHQNLHRVAHGRQRDLQRPDRRQR